MSLRIRKKIKIAPGVNLNIGKKSIGMSVGAKGIHHSVNSSGRKTNSIGIPGTGISYVSSSGGNSSNGKRPSNGKGIPQRRGNYIPWYKKTGWIIALIILFFPVGIYLMWKYTDWSVMTKSIISGIIAVIAIIGIANPSSKSNEEATQQPVTNQIEANQEIDITDTQTPQEAIPTPAEEPTPEVTPEPTTEQVVANDVVNVRAQDNTDADILGKSAVGDVFTRYEAMDNGWSRIDYNGSDAYMKSEYLEPYTGEASLQKEIAVTEEVVQASDEAVLPDTSTPVVAPIIVPEPETIQSSGIMVWISDSGNGKCYHSDPICGNMKNAKQISLEDAKANYEPCDKCY